MFGNVARDDFEWVYSDQPHSARRGLMLKKYPVIKKYMCVDPHLKYIVSAMVAMQVVMAYLLQDSSWWTIVFWVSWTYEVRSLQLKNRHTLLVVQSIIAWHWPSTILVIIRHMVMERIHTKIVILDLSRIYRLEFHILLPLKNIILITIGIWLGINWIQIYQLNGKADFLPILHLNFFGLS